jgi:putative aldouronate transport system substrate-binding protein
MMKKAFILLMVMAVILNFAACNTSSEKNPSESSESSVSSVQTTKAVTTTKAPEPKTTTSETTTVIENPFAEKFEFNFLGNPEFVEGRWDKVELEEKFNVKFNFWDILVKSGANEQVDMMLAAGDVPDYGFYYKSGVYMVEQGLGRTVPLNLIKQYYPGYYKKMLEDAVGFHMNRVEGTEDLYYGLTALTPRATHTGYVPLWRLDWLENIGYEPENLTPMKSVVKPEWDDTVYFSTTKFSLDDVKEILRAFTEDDPDDNGVDDTYGSTFTGSINDSYITYNMFGYDKDDSHFYKDPVTGDFVPYYAYTPYRDYLQYVREMLDKGFLRSVNAADLQSIWATGKVGYMNTRSGYRILGTYADMEQWPPASILLQDPDARFVITPVPGENGKYRPYATFNWDPSVTYPIAAHVSDEKLIRLFQILDYTYFGEDWIRYKWGIEHIHYKWAGEPFNSPLIFTDPEKIPPQYKGRGEGATFGQFGNQHFINDYKIYMNFDACTVQWVEFWNKYHPGGFYDDSLWIRPDKYYSAFTMPMEMYKEFKTLQEETSAQINAVHKDFITRFNQGQIANIDNEWEQYIEQIYAAGLDKWVEIWNRDEIKTFEYYRTYVENK